MHKPPMDMSLFALPSDVRVWLLAVWCLGIWCMDHEDSAFAREAWDVQRALWGEETALQVVEAPDHHEDGLWMDHVEPAALPEPEPERFDPSEEDAADMIRFGWPGAVEYRGQPPRVAIYRVGPRLPDVFLSFGDYVTWRWIW